MAAAVDWSILTMNNSPFRSGSHPSDARGSMRTSPTTTHKENYDHWQHWSAGRRAMTRKQSDLLAEDVDPEEAQHMVLPGAPKKRAATPAFETIETATKVATYFKAKLSEHRGETSSVATEDTINLPVLQRGNRHYFELNNIYNNTNHSRCNNSSSREHQREFAAAARLSQDEYNSNCDSKSHQRINNHNNISSSSNFDLDRVERVPQHLSLDSNDGFEGEVFEDVGLCDLQRSVTFLAEQEEILARFKQQQLDQNQQQSPNAATAVYGTQSNRGAHWSDDDNSSEKKKRFAPPVAVAYNSSDSSSDKKMKANSGSSHSGSPPRHDPDIPDWLHNAARKDGRKIKVVGMNPSNTECKTVCCIGCQKTMLCAVNVEVVFCPCCNSIFNASAMTSPAGE